MLWAKIINLVTHKKKIELNKAGGYVTLDRVNGNLNLSRAIGDFTYKETKSLPTDQQMVICVPEIQVTDIDKKTEFFIIACDGIWDWMNDQEAVDYINEKQKELK